MRKATTDMWNSVLDVVYPPRCAACGSRGSWICNQCLIRCTAHRKDACSRCGSRRTGERCITCYEHIRNLAGLTAAYEYDGPVRDLVHRFKYRGQSGAASWMGGCMSDVFGQMVEALIPVPIDPQRLRERGYNQAELLAKSVSKRAGIPTMSALVRTRHVDPQARLQGRERWENIKGVFSPAKGITLPPIVAIVDDVCTTGATAEECAKVLRSMGASRVVALVFARA